MDRYQKGMDDTKATLDEYGVGYFGYSKSYIKEVKGIKFGFLGYAFPNAVSDDMKNAITELKKKTDFVMRNNANLFLFIIIGVLKEIIALLRDKEI